MFVVGGILFAVIWMGGKKSSARTNDIHSEALNFSFTPPGEPWKTDEEMKSNRMGVNVAVYERSGPAAWVALAAKDFGSRTPVHRELENYLESRLRRIFDNLNMEEKQEATWTGRPALRYEFRATAKGTDAVMIGECYALTCKGIAYWFFAWASQHDISSIHEEFEPIRERLTILPGRENWKEATPTKTVLTGIGGYTLTDREGIWTKPPLEEPKDEDPKADLLAQAVDPAKGPRSDSHPTARLVVFLLDANSDPLTTARKYVVARYNRNPETFGPTTIEELTDAPQGESPPGEQFGETKSIRLKLTRPNSPSSAKLLVVAGIKLGEKVVAVELSCPLFQRSIWEKRLLALAASLSVGQ
jgi:hypothetical protein